MQGQTPECPIIFWLHCLIQVTSITSSHTPLFICAISSIHWPAIVYQALCYVLGMCLTLCDLMDNPPVSCVLGILQARTLEWVAISSSGVSSRPRDWTHVSHDSCMTRLIFFLNHWAPHWEGLGSLVCCSPWDHKESDMTKQLNTTTKIFNGSPHPDWRQAQGSVIDTMI